MADIDEIKKLSPEERLKRLKKLEEERRKEIEEAEKLRIESVGQLEREEEIRQKIPVPQMKAVDIDQLFTKEEKQIFAAKRYQKTDTPEEEPAEKPKPEEKTLEDEVIHTPTQLTHEQAEQQKAYGEQLAQEQSGQLYQMAREAYNEFKETGQVDQGKMYALDVAARSKDASAPGGEYKAPTEEAQEQFGSVKSIVKYLRGK
jgi:hypothetical protein